MYNYGYDYGQTVEKAANTAAGVAIWTIIALILAIVGGILVYFLFIKGKNELSAGWKKFRDLLDFKTMLIEPIMKILYLILTIFIILFSFNLISVNFVAFLFCLILGPIVIRVIYETAMMTIMIWKNTKELNENVKTMTKQGK